MFAFAHFYIGRELYIDKGDGSTPDFRFYQVARVKPWYYGSDIIGIEIFYESTDGRGVCFSEVATGSIRRMSRGLVLNFFHNEHFSRVFVDALKAFHGALRDGVLNSWIVDRKGVITEILKTFYWLESHWDLYQRDKIGRRLSKTPHVDDDEEAVATVQLDENTIIRGEVFVRREQLEELYNSLEAPLANVQRGPDCSPSHHDNQPVQAEPADPLRAGSDALAPNGICARSDSNTGLRPRHNYQRARAERVLFKLYPEGLPSRDLVSDQELYDQVCRNLSGKPVSIWTVRRAAKRGPREGSKNRCQE
jgi:hypothetical protein